VTLRFLVALSRHDDLEWDLDVLDRLKDIARSRYVVGVDFMGHERTRRARSCRSSRRSRNGRARSGPASSSASTPARTPGTRERPASRWKRRSASTSSCASATALYGVDDETLDELARRGVIVEFQPRLELRAEQRAERARGADRPATWRAGCRRARHRRLRVYETTPASRRGRRACSASRTTTSSACSRTEAAYVARRHARDRDVTDDPAAFVAPPEKPSTHYGPEVPARAARARAARDAALEARLTEIGAVKVELEALERLARRRLVVSIGGAWKRSWAATSGVDRARVEALIAALFQKLDPGEAI